MSIITRCSHCGELRKGEANKFCKDCNTAERRKEMDENNKKIWDERRKVNPKLPEYKCKYCDRKEE